MSYIRNFSNSGLSAWLNIFPECFTIFYCVTVLMGYDVVFGSLDE